jgi:hypothetical protein
MRRFSFFLIALVVFATASLASPALAQQKSNINQLLKDTAGPQGAGYDVSANPNTGLATVAGRVVNIFLSLLGIIFVCLVIYGGFLWMTAAGNEDQVEKAKKIISQSVIGLVIILSAWAIYTFIISVLGSVTTDGGSSEPGPVITTG